MSGNREAPKLHGGMPVEKPKSILVVVERSAHVSRLVNRAVGLARRLGATVELFLCDSEQAYVLAHAYDQHGISAARSASIAAAHRYLGGLRELATAAGVEAAVDAQCESPLYEAVVRKVIRSASGMVVKAMAVESARQRGTPDPNDWQLIRTCPATLMLSGQRDWSEPPRVAAAVDASERESAEIARSVIEAATMLAGGLGAQLQVVYGETASAPLSNAHLQKLRALCDAADVPPERTHILQGQPELTLPKFINQQGYDVIVLGALAHRVGGTTPVGTLTSTLLESAGCDFVLVKPASYRSPIESAAR
jgi:universal stress protein E